MLPYKPPVMIFKTDFKQHFKKKNEKSMAAYNGAWGREGNEIKRY